MAELTFSHSMIEAWWRDAQTTVALSELTRQHLHASASRHSSTFKMHDTSLPDSAFRGQTPDEMDYGIGVHVPRELEPSTNCRPEGMARSKPGACTVQSAQLNGNQRLPDQDLDR